jgi:hypothetical protein
MNMTITEALAEIKTINKRLEKKRSSILQYIARDVRLKDPLEGDGGTIEFIKRERQAIYDLEKRIVAIRTQIQRSNLATTLAIDGHSMCVAEWLTYRREVADGQKSFLTKLIGGISATRDEIQKKGGRMLTANVASLAIVETGKPAFEVIVSVDEKDLLSDAENLETILGSLDGKLSLLNATTVIEV